MNAASSGVTRSGKPSAFGRRSADPRSACARCAAGGKTISKLPAMADLSPAKLKVNWSKGHARLREALLLLDHLAAFFADLVLVVLEAGEKHARILALALAELDDVGPTGGALLGRALGEREGRKDREGNNESKTLRHQSSFLEDRLRLSPANHVTSMAAGDQRSSQVGVRLSMKAPIPSSASRASMFSTITSQA